MPNKRLMIVDDSVTIRAMIEQIFSNNRLIDIVSIAGNGEDAISHIKTSRPDVITLDLFLPGMDGFGVLHSIMTSFPIAVIVISSAGLEGSDEYNKAMELGASAVFDKAKILRDAEKLRTAVINAKLGRRLVKTDTAEKSGRL